MKIRHSAGALAGTVSLIAVLTVPAAPTQGAAKAVAECPAKALCVWSKANFEGNRVVLDKLGASNKIFNKMNDQVSSARLRYSGGAAQLYEDTNGEGNTLCLLDAPGLRKYPDLSENGGIYNNAISSSYLSAEPFGTCF